MFSKYRSEDEDTIETVTNKFPEARAEKYNERMSYLRDVSLPVHSNLTVIVAVLHRDIKTVTN